jgi:hypothetical protein
LYGIRVNGLDYRRNASGDGGNPKERLGDDDRGSRETVARRFENTIESAMFLYRTASSPARDRHAAFVADVAA